MPSDLARLALMALQSPARYKDIDAMIHEKKRVSTRRLRQEIEKMKLQDQKIFTILNAEWLKIGQDAMA